MPPGEYKKHVGSFAQQSNYDQAHSWKHTLSTLLSIVLREAVELSRECSSNTSKWCMELEIIAYLTSSRLGLTWLAVIKKTPLDINFHFHRNLHKQSVLGHRSAITV